MVLKGPLTSLESILWAPANHDSEGKSYLYCQNVTHFKAGAVDKGVLGGGGTRPPKIAVKLTPVGGMAVPLEKVSPRTFVPRYKCPPGHSYLGKNVPPGKSVPSINSCYLNKIVNWQR